MNVVSVQARMASERLPGKVMAPFVVEVPFTMNFEVQPMLALMVDRIRPLPVVIATTTLPDDDPIADLAERIGCAYVRGPVDDLMARHLQAADLMGAEVIGICGADDPLLDSRLFQSCFDRLAGRVRYVETRGVPLGINVFAVDREALEDAVRECSDPHLRAEVHPWFKAQPERYPAEYVDAYRLTVDEQPDLDLHRAIFEGLYGGNPRFGWEHAVAFLADHPEIARMNAGVGQRFRF